jgi:hypothetical protein
MNLTVPDRIQTFVGLFASSLDKRKCVVFPLLLSCLLLCRGAKSYAGLSRTIVTYERNRASVSKFFCRQRLHSRNIYEDAMNAVMEQYIEHDQVVKPVVWILAIDGVCSKRGGFAKIDNAIKYRKKRKDTGPTTKAHTFIQGLLITHTGMRIPLPRRTYYTRKYCWKHKKKYLKMTQLAALIIATVKVPPLVQIVVVADEFFEGTTMDKACNEREYIYIVPIDKRRCGEDQYGKRTAQNLHRHGKSLDRKKLKKIVFKPYQERTALLRRRTGDDKKQRVYFAISEVRRISGLGERTIVYSWKPQTKSGRWKSNWFKALVSNAKDCDVATLIEYYELRWQIEIFFRELKSFMGLTDFTGGNFAAYERFVDMVLLAYLFLEWYRVQLVSEANRRKDLGRLQAARTRSLLQVFQGEADAASVDYISECGKETEVFNALLASIKRSQVKILRL